MDKYKIFLIVSILGVLVWSRIWTIHPDYWLLENLPVFAAFIVYILLLRYIQLSNFSYTLIAIYLILPLVTSRYGVSSVPIGHTLGEWLGSTRNLYDKLTHFAFGFLWVYPIKEYVQYLNKGKSKWDYYIPLITIIAAGALYEIFEWIAAISVNPVLANQFYGSQGDIFDTQKDMAIATIGALSAIALIYFYEKFRKTA
jgi:putative membrane protein